MVHIPTLLEEISTLKEQGYEIKDRLINTFDEFFGGSIVGKKQNSSSPSGYTLGYKDYVFGKFNFPKPFRNL